jgi:anhydro-N-acetylmuramic acid kinase
MVYKVIGIMSGSSVDGLDIAYVHLHETGGKWGYEILAAECVEYTAEWKQQLTNAIHLSGLEYQLLHTRYGHFIGEKINHFITENGLQHKIDLIASHGHTTFHLPKQKMTAQIGDGAAIAAETQLPVVSDLRSLDIAFGGQGAPIVPIGQKLLFPEYHYFLNIGGIANVSVNNGGKYIAFDVCPANRILNMFAEEMNMEHDESGKIAASGKVNEALLQQLNALTYYQQPFPKSLANSFGVETVYPLIKKAGLTIPDALCTYVEHIALQIKNALFTEVTLSNAQLFVTGGGALNTYLIERLKAIVSEKGIEVIVPDERLVQYKEALVMALLGALRWREETTVLSSVTGATTNSVGGALWLGRL